MRKLEKEFREELSKMPAERVGLKQIDEFIIELYTDNFYGNKLQVYRKDSDNNWIKLGQKTFNALVNARYVFDEMKNKNYVTDFCEKYKEHEN